MHVYVWVHVCAYVYLRVHVYVADCHCRVNTHTLRNTRVKENLECPLCAILLDGCTGVVRPPGAAHVPTFSREVPTWEPVTVRSSEKVSSKISVYQTVGSSFTLVPSSARGWVGRREGTYRSGLGTQFVWRNPPLAGSDVPSRVIPLTSHCPVRAGAEVRSATGEEDDGGG